MNRAVIEERIHAAIRPQIAYADRAIWDLTRPQTIGRHSPQYFEPVPPVSTR